MWRGGEDLAALSDTHPFTLTRKASVSPKHSFVLSPATKIRFLPALHPSAFELVEERGFFGGGSTRLVLRAVGEVDAQEWFQAINTCLYTVVHVLHSS